MMCNYLLLVGKYYIIKTAILLWRNSVKKFSKFIICLCLMCSFVFAGCNLVQRNTDRYLNRTVATIGNEIKITKKNYRKGDDGYKIVSVRMKDELIEQLDIISQRTNRSRNELINMLLNAAIDLVEIEED